MPVPDNTILTGYYRYTDIFYEWWVPEVMFRIDLTRVGQGTCPS
jgi:hypothetical protein